MARKSSIKTLPIEIREQIDALLRQEVTLDQIREKLGELGADVSRSALGRYKQQIDKVGERLKRSREISQVFVERLGAAPEGKQGRMILELMQTVIFDHLVPEDENGQLSFDSEAIFNLAAAVKNLASAEKISADRELVIRKAILKEAAEAAVMTARSNALSTETVNQIKASILGIERRG